MPHRIIRRNLLTEENYTPYCGQHLCRGGWPRTKFNGSQFQCPDCGWKSQFEPEFIQAYIEKWEKNKKAS